jgi:AcrR family transcriptional regulator
VTAAFDALRSGGPQAVKVESIAKALKVSKGSFYWHFKNASDLKSAMLDQWMAVATMAIIQEVESNLKDSDQTLHHLVRISAANLSNSSQHASLNQAAIRDWARYDSEVAIVLKKVDKKRLDYVTRGFRLAGFKPKQSTENAKILYAALIGLECLARHNLAEIEKDLPRLLTTLLETKSG